MKQMICANCQYRKENDAVKQLEGEVSWFCTHKHSECEDVVCLLRMIIWELDHIEETLEES